MERLFGKWLMVVISAAIDLWPEIQTAMADGKITDDEMEKILKVAARSAILGITGAVR